MPNQEAARALSKDSKRDNISNQEIARVISKDLKENNRSKQMDNDLPNDQENPSQDKMEHVPFPTTESIHNRHTRLQQLLQMPSLQIEELRKLAWKGIPSDLRPLCWKILMGYLPTSKDRRGAILERKRAEYRDIVEQHFSANSRRDEAIMHQIAIDVPRTAPDVILFRNPIIREALARILYCWSIRRPASGYVQGINDLVTPFYEVFLTEYLAQVERDGTEYSPRATISIPESAIFNVEADSFWCLSKLLDSIQDNYTFNQAGITRQLTQMRNILLRTDPRLVEHLEREGISMLQFAFRWINCLLMREFPLHIIVRMWDTYMAEGDDGFSHFHTYVCAAFLSRWSDQLQLLDFQETILFLQSPPTALWGLADIEMLLSEAYVWKSLFHDSHGHLPKAKR